MPSFKTKSYFLLAEVQKKQKMVSHTRCSWVLQVGMHVVVVVRQLDMLPTHPVIVFLLG